mmetsp:Transcript_12531/g.27010  ORF Transcript_12531/g.27010 Transcript_12531/m.27010 type:complete len:328 (-) Transcript_12531:59-1042(-)
MIHSVLGGFSLLLLLRAASLQHRNHLLVSLPEDALAQLAPPHKFIRQVLPHPLVVSGEVQLGLDGSRVGDGGVDRRGVEEVRPRREHARVAPPEGDPGHVLGTNAVQDLGGLDEGDDVLDGLAGGQVGVVDIEFLVGFLVRALPSPEVSDSPTPTGLGGKRIAVVPVLDREEVDVHPSLSVQLLGETDHVPRAVHRVDQNGGVEGRTLPPHAEEGQHGRRRVVTLVGTTLRVVGIDVARGVKVPLTKGHEDVTHLFGKVIEALVEVRLLHVTGRGNVLVFVGRSALSEQDLRLRPPLPLLYFDLPQDVGDATGRREGVRRQVGEGED